jgi:hypothetical protein
MNGYLFDSGRMQSPVVRRSAEISGCGRYRWWLRRAWGDFDGRIVCFVMLNPSTADALRDDPTIRRCIGFAKSWGYTALSVRNLFAYRATDPKELRTASDPTGGSRGDNELLVSRSADLVICAWGAGVPFGRDRWMIENFGTVPLHCLGTTKDGSPRHPLYVRGDVRPIVYRRGRAGSQHGPAPQQPQHDHDEDDDQQQMDQTPGDREDQPTE